MTGFALLLASLLILGSTFPAQTASFKKADLNQLVNDYLARQPTTVIPHDLTMKQANKIQRNFVERLESNLDEPVGYKVGLVNRAAQQKFGLQGPVRGILLSKMLLKNGAELPANFGVQPLVEADLMVVVGSSRINKARTPLDALSHLREVVAFIELPDNILSTNQPVNGAMLTAANVGARFGIIGGRVPVEATPHFLKALAEMEITIRNRDGEILAEEKGKKILDHPIHALLWLIEDLRKSRIKLREGDMISLGAVHQMKPTPGQTIFVRYDGLPGGTLRAMVQFKP